MIMNWRDTWHGILSGGPGLWKVNDIQAKRQALVHILDHVLPQSEKGSCGSSTLRILCPLAGDDSFIHYAYSEGHDVTAIDIVPEALQEMRRQFGPLQDWSCTHCDTIKAGLVWKHVSGRVTQYEGDMLMNRPEMHQLFDAVYDKDSFGALPIDLRPAYCQVLSDYLRDNGTLYLEVKNKSFDRESGPPFHVEKHHLLETSNFGNTFEHVASLGEVYSLDRPDAIQTGHILRRKERTTSE